MRMRMDREQKNLWRDRGRRRAGSRGTCWAALLGVLLACLLWVSPVYAADGTLSIAVSSANVAAGEEVSVTLSAAGSGGEKATADMEFTYNSSVFSFVSCNAEGYGGGEGGKVTFRGSSVTVKLKATGSGSCNLKVTGSNGTVRESGASLDNMVAAGTTISAGAPAGSAKSSDNSLASLSLSVGELSPAFVYSTTSYTAAVPYETTSVEVIAQASHGKAQITSIEGNTDLSVGENTIKITVKAENDALAVYTITVTRAEEPSAPLEEPTSQTPQTPAGDGTEGTEGDVTPKPPQDQSLVIEEYESRLENMSQQYAKLEEKYQAEKSFHRKLMAVLIFVIAVLLIVCVNLVISLRGRNQEEEEEPKKRERTRKRPASAAEKRRTAHSPEKKKSPRRFPRKEKEDWLDEDEEDDMDNAIFSRTAIPAPKPDSAEKSMDFIDLDDL